MNTFSSRTVIFILLIPFFLFLACGKDDPEVQARKDRDKILKYIQENDLDAYEHESGLFFVIEVEGSGGHPNINSTVVINYTGKLLNGDIFDANNYAVMPLRNTILGWREGIPLFKRGGKGLLLIPSGLAYGRNARPGIPANSVLVFEIELIEFNN